MKQKLPVLIAAFCVLSSVADVAAQTRGPRYNPPSGGGGGGSSSSSSSSSRSSGSSYSGGSSSSSSSSRGSSYNPPSRSSGSSSSSSSSSSRGSSYNPPSRSSGSSSSSSSSSSRGSNYNPPSSSSGSSSSSSSSRGSTYNPPSSSSGSSSSNTTPRGPRYNPPSTTDTTPSYPSRPSTPGYDTTPSTPRGPRYNPPTTGSTPSYPTPSAPRGPRYNPPIRVYRPAPHVPHYVRPGVIIYTTPRSYYTHIHRRYIYRRWILEPVVFTYSDGYYDMDGYPYYVYNGYRYRYNPVETCKYELVDGEDNTTVRAFPEMSCSAAYDSCAVERDTMNRAIGLERFFCAEAVDEDLAQADTTSYQSTPVEITAERLAQIENFLAGKSFKDLYKSAPVGNCTITKHGGLFGGGNKYDCQYVIRVSGKAFPLTDESVCSDDQQAEAIGCSIGTEKENAGCILSAAIKAGYCL